MSAVLFDRKLPLFPQAMESCVTALFWNVNSNIHDALALENAPVPQGMFCSCALFLEGLSKHIAVCIQNFRMSRGFPLQGNTPEATFYNYIFNLLCRRTALSEDIHGVAVDAVGGNICYSTHCLQKIWQGEFDKAKEILLATFSQLNPPAASIMEWSLAAEAAGFVCGHIYSARGGHRVSIELIRFPRGIFRCP